MDLVIRCEGSSRNGPARVTKRCRDLIHTDGSVGTDGRRRRLSDTAAVMDHDRWDRENPRRMALVWSQGEAGHRQVQAALDGLRHLPDGTAP
ncbi:hypothetical protein [Streptomyces erythrochromogenes]|uniref:hypothetical protein n=1 Tax=Streptomyces erythrochromogenes TaxID=285574 RepID=UPI003800D23D